MQANILTNKDTLLAFMVAMGSPSITRLPEEFEAEWYILLQLGGALDGNCND